MRTGSVAAQLAARHPRLYHQMPTGLWESVAAHGLLPPRLLLERIHQPPAVIDQLTRTPRPETVVIEPTPLGRVAISDNKPLSETALERCLDDGLTPADWCAMLAERVFFWTHERDLRGLLAARSIRDQARDVLVIDTLGFVRAHAGRVELSPINSGSTIRTPARRGLGTYAKLLEVESLREWRERRMRAGVKTSLDEVKELVVRGATDVAPFVVERRRYEGGSYAVV